MGTIGSEVKVRLKSPPIVRLKVIKKSRRDSFRDAREAGWMDSVCGQQDCKKYRRFAIRIGSNCEADISDFPGIQQLGRFNDRILQGHLVNETDGIVHNPLLPDSGWLVGLPDLAPGYCLGN
jgi:hypothetical protein